MSAVASEPDDQEAPIVGRKLHPVGDQILIIADAMDLLSNFQMLVASLIENRPALAVVPLGEFAFIQVMAIDDGGLRLESSASAAVLAANLGFGELVEQHEHVAGANLPADWNGREMIAAETMMRLAVDVHGMMFPAKIEFRISLIS